MIDITGWIEALERDREERQICTGFQAWAAQDGELIADVASGVDGLGANLSTEHLSALYCAGKPLVALAIGRLVDTGQLDLDERVGFYLSGLQASLGAVTLAELLSHRAGLHEIRAEWMSVLPLERHWALIARADVPAVRPDIGTYANYAGWLIAGRVIERATGTDLRKFIVDEVLRPLGVEEELFVGFDVAAWDTHADRLVVNVDLRVQPPVPLLYERADRLCREVRPAIGVYGSARGLGRLYERLGEALSGAGATSLLTPATLRRLTTPATRRGYDVVLERHCQYGLGFMVRLTDHGFGTSISPNAFGHSGYESTTFGFWDPDRSLACAVRYFGVVEDQRALLRRERTLDELAQCIDRTSPSAAPALA